MIMEFLVSTKVGIIHTAKIESTGGEAKTSPQIAAVSIPSPTNPA